MILTLLALAYALWAFADRLGMCYVVLGAALLLAWAWWELRGLPRPISRPIANKELASVCFLLIDSVENPLFEQLLWWVLPRGICVKRFQYRVMLRDYTVVYSWPPVDYYTSAERLLRRALPENFLVRHLLHWLFHDMPRGGMCPVDGIKTGAGSTLFGFCDYMSWFSSTKPYLYISTSNVLEMQDSDNARLAEEASCKANGASTLPGGTSGRAFNPMGDSTTQHRHAPIAPSTQPLLEQPDEPDIASVAPMPKPDGNRPNKTVSTATASTPVRTAKKPNKQVPRGGVQKPANVEPDYSQYDGIDGDGLKKILKARRISPGYYKPRLYCHDCFVYCEEIKEASKKMNLAMKDYQIQDAQRNTSYGISWRRAICAFIEAKGAWYDLALKAKEHATKQCKARPENRAQLIHSREICPKRECDTQERTPPKDSAQSPASTSSSASIGLSPAGRDATAGDIAQAATQQQGPRTFDVGAAVPTQNAIDDNGAASDRMLNGQLGSSWQPRGWQPGDKPPVARAQTAAILKVTTTTPAPSLVAAASTASTAASYQVAAPSAPSNNDGAADTAALANSTSTLPTSTMVDNALPANEATNADATPANANSAGDSTVDNAASVHIIGAAVKTSSASNTSDPPGNDSVGCSTPVKRKPKRATGNPSQQDIEEAFRKKKWRPSSFDRCPNSKRGRRRQLRRNASVFKNMAHVPTQQRAHTTLRKRVAALVRHVGTNSGAVTGCLSGGRGRIEGDTVYIAAPQQAPTTFDAGATVPTQHTIAGNGAVSYWMLYGNFGPNWRPRGWLPGDKVPRGWLPGDKPPVARTQPATTSATTSTISGSRTVAPPATTSTIAGARTVAPLATTSTTARTQPATASATNSTIAGARPEAPPATTSMVAGSRTVAQPANTTTVARTQPVTASATTSTTTGSQPATASTTTSTIAGARTVAPPATTSTTTDSHPEALPATTSMTTGARPIATPIGRTTFAGTRPAAPSANTTTTAHTQPQNNGPGQRALPRQDRKRHCKAGIEPLPEPPVNDEDTYGIHGSQELDDFKKKYLGLVENYPPARDLYLNLFSRRQRLGTRLVTDDTLRVDRIYYALLCLAIDRAVRCNSLDRLEDLFALLLEANDEVILSRYIRERRQETIHDID